MIPSFENFIFESRCKIHVVQGGGIISGLAYQNTMNWAHLHQTTIRHNLKKVKEKNHIIKKTYHRWQEFYNLQEQVEWIKILFQFLHYRLQNLEAYSADLCDLIIELIEYHYGYRLLAHEETLLKTLIANQLKQQFKKWDCILWVSPKAYLRYQKYTEHSFYKLFFKVYRHPLIDQNIKVFFLNKTYFLQESVFWYMTQKLDSNEKEN